MSILVKFSTVTNESMLNKMTILSFLNDTCFIPVYVAIFL